SRSSLSSSGRVGSTSRSDGGSGGFRSSARHGGVTDPEDGADPFGWASCRSPPCDGEAEAAQSFAGGLVGQLLREPGGGPSRVGRCTGTRTWSLVDDCRRDRDRLGSGVRGSVIGVIPGGGGGGGE